MTDFRALLDSAEDNELEFKAAQGTHGKGAIPQSLWESYSAMANTNGGTIYLGVSETETGFAAQGIKNIVQVRKSFWNSVNNIEVVNTNILRDEDVTVLTEANKHILSVHVPRAKREDKPIYVKSNPFTGTYKRNYEGDYKCDRATVQRMIAEAQEPARDSRFLAKYTMDDLDAESLRLFHQIFANTNANHPFLTSTDQEMLRQLGGWKRDRETDETGLTAAGLLMFGQLPAILEVFSDYKLDYRELPSSQEEQAQEKWLDRIHTDGSWAGNLFSFYRSVYDRLVEDLKVPYRVTTSGQRLDQSPVHEALREALVNALIHADFSARSAILITKKSGEFRFTNPGNLRLPFQLVMDGGYSDCRNPSLQKMFYMIGAAEQAGSDIPKIWGAWRALQLKTPILVDSNEPEYTSLSMPTISLLPDAEMALLRDRFGEAFDLLSEAEKLAVVTAHMEGTIYNRRLRELIDMHPADCSSVFKGLMEKGFLEQDRAGRATTYHISNKKVSSGEIPELEPQIPEPNSGITPPDSGISQGNSGITTPDVDIYGLTDQEKQRLMAIAEAVRASRKVPKPTVYSTIIRLCEDGYRTPKLLEELLGRTEVRRNYLTEMVGRGDLERKYPDVLNSPDQAYKATERARATLYSQDLSLFPDQNIT